MLGAGGDVDDIDIGSRASARRPSTLSCFELAAANPLALAQLVVVAAHRADVVTERRASRSRPAKGSVDGARLLLFVARDSELCATPMVGDDEPEAREGGCLVTAV